MEQSGRALNADVAGKIKTNVAEAAEDVKDMVSKISHIVGSRRSWFAAVSFTVIGIILWILLVWNPLEISSSFPLLTSFLTLFLFALSAFGYNWISNTVDCSPISGCTFSTGTGNSTVYSFLSKGATVIFLTLSLFALLVLFVSLIVSLGIGTKLFKRFILIMVSITSLSLLYSVSKQLQKLVNEPARPPTYTKLLARLVFYIPCMLRDAVIAVLGEVRMQKQITWAVLGMEAALISAYFLIPFLIKWIANFNRSQLLNEPMYLDKETVHGDFETLYNAVKRDGSYAFEKADRYVYTLSSWFRINPTPASYGTKYAQDSNIITFGDRPRVTYNNETRRFKVQCKLSETSTVTVYETDELPLLRWNNVTVACDGASMTVFLNGELVGSEKNISPLVEYNLVVCGQRGGIQGAVDDISFSRRALHPGEVKLAYQSKTLTLLDGVSG